MSQGKIVVQGRTLLRARPEVVEVVLEGGRVRTIRKPSTRHPDFGGPSYLLAPTLVDIQVNGAAGIDLQSDAVNPSALWRITEYLRAWGVTRWVPTLITSPLDMLEERCRGIAAACREPELCGAILGIHIEGPWISPLEGYRGAHPQEYVCPPSFSALARLQRAAEGRIVYTTVAPEWPQAQRFIRHAVEQGIAVALGHHAATAAQVRAAADAGATLCTHLGNGIAVTLHRHYNPLWPQLDEGRLFAAFIADGHHVPAEMLRVMIRAKGAHRVVLVSDQVSLSGMRAGMYRQFGQTVRLTARGRVEIPGTHLLAGSAVPLFCGIRHAVAIGALTWREAFAAGCTRPLQALRRRAITERGIPMYLRVGAPANFLLVEEHAAAMEPPSLVLHDGVAVVPSRR